MKWPAVKDSRSWSELQEEVIACVDKVCTAAAIDRRGAGWAIDFLSRTISEKAEAMCGSREPAKGKTRNQGGQSFEDKLVGKLRVEVRRLSKQWRRDQRANPRAQREMKIFQDLSQLRNLYASLKSRQARAVKEQLEITENERCDTNRWQYAT